VGSILVIERKQPLADINLVSIDYIEKKLGNTEKLLKICVKSGKNYNIIFIKIFYFRGGIDALYCK
jgi:hypothetical protein